MEVQDKSKDLSSSKKKKKKVLTNIYTCEVMSAYIIDCLENWIKLITVWSYHLG